MIAGSDNFIQVPVEATAFVGAAAAFVMLLLVFFLYINKKWCFYGLGGFPCCDEVLAKKPTPTTQSNQQSADPAAPYSYSAPATSSDSEEDASRRQPHLDFGPSCSIHASYQHRPHARIQVNPRSEQSRPMSGTDLISLAEKGKVNCSNSSSESSSCSTTSGDDESHSAKQRETRYRKLQSAAATTPPCSIDIDTMDEQTSPLTTSYNANFNNQYPQEQLYDITDLQSEPESSLISKCGHIEVAFAYDAPTRKMTVRVLQARDIPTKERGGSQNTQVRLLLLPSKKQKHKSKIRQGGNPHFMESFLLHRINPEDVNSMGVRFRVYGCERMRRERMIGECVVGFSCINLELETTMWLILEPRANMALMSSTSDLLSLARSDSTGSTHSMQHGGVSELLLGLAYNGTTGRLSVEIVKGSHFSRNLALSRAPDTYVKLCLVSSNGHEMARSKTSIRRGQPSPLFKETFMFQVALFQLPDVTLMISVFSKRSMKRKEMLGWFSLGQNSSGEEELAHWNDMRDVHGEQISRWHVLVDT